MEPKLNCGKVTFKGKAFDVYRNPELLFVWISEENRTPFSFTNLHDYKATNDDEAKRQAMLMLNEFEYLFIN